MKIVVATEFFQYNLAMQSDPQPAAVHSSTPPALSEHAKGTTSATSSHHPDGPHGIPVPWAAAGSVALVLLGAYLKYLFDRKNAKANLPTKTLVCRATFCPDLLSPTVSQWHDDLELRVHGEPLKSPVVIHYRLEYTGNTTATCVAMRVRSSQADRILRWNFYVDQDLKCNRLKTKTESPTELFFEWAYLNPSDTIDLVLLVSPCSDARCVALEVDGEGLKVSYRADSRFVGIIVRARVVRKSFV